MKVKHGKGKTEYGPGVQIDLSGEEVARAIESYLIARGAVIRGERTITVNGRLCEHGQVYVDPAGFVVYKGKKIEGRGNGV
jgi:hypothetical protein